MKSLWGSEGHLGSFRQFLAIFVKSKKRAELLYQSLKTWPGGTRCKKVIHDFNSTLIFLVIPYNPVSWIDQDGLTNYLYNKAQQWLQKYLHHHCFVKSYKILVMLSRMKWFHLDKYSNCQFSFHKIQNFSPAWFQMDNSILLKFRLTVAQVPGQFGEGFMHFRRSDSGNIKHKGA